MQRRRQDLAAHGEDAAGLAHGLLEVAGDVGHRDDEEVAEAVTFEALPSLKRYWKSCDISGSASASAAMLLRMSPGGSTPSSRWSRPELPPSSATVTMAVMLPVYSLSPRSSVERPVPPPMDDDLGAAAQVAVVVDDVDDALVALGLDEGGEQRLVQLPDGEPDDAERGADEQGATRT